MRTRLGSRFWVGSCLGGLVAALGLTLHADEIGVLAKGTETGFRRERLVEWSVPEPLRDKPLTVRSGAAVVPSQLTLDRTALRWRSTVGAETAPQLEFRIATADPPEATAKAEARKTDEAVELRIADHAVLTYHTASRLAAGVNAIYRRSGHIHPLTTPGGLVVTDEFPADHLHQHAIFFAWVNTQFQGRHIDFWNQPAREGTVEHSELVSTDFGPVWAGFHAKLSHAEKRGDTPSKPVLREDWFVTATRLGDLHVVDLESRQRAVSADPLEILKYHYGGFGIRGAASWGSACTFLTSEGDDRLKGNHTHCRWVRLTGRVEEKECGLAVLSDPKNFRAPQAVRLHPTMPYFAFSPCVDGGFSIGNDADYVSRYRILAFDGTLAPEQLDTLWNDFSNPLVAVETQSK